MNICIIAAMAEELNALENLFIGFKKAGALRYAVGEVNIHLLKCGVLFRKPKRLERKLDILKKSDIVILCGISGAVQKKLKIGDIVIPDKIISMNNKAEYLTNYKPEYLKNFLKKTKLNIIIGGVLATSDHFVSTEEKEKMSSVDIVDMESYNVLNWFNEMKIPVFCVRSVSDTKFQVLPEEKDIVKYIIDPKKFLITNFSKSPIICYRLLKLSYLSKIALNNLSVFINDFILFQSNDKLEY